MPSRKDRPILVSLISLIWIFVGIFIILSGLLLIATSPGFLIGFSIILVGIVIFALGFGLWNLSFLAWFITVILYGAAALVYILNYDLLLQALQAGDFSYLLTPIVTIILFLYFFSVKDKFS